MKEKGFLFIPSNIHLHSVEESDDDLFVTFIRWSDVTRSVQSQLVSVSMTELKAHIEEFPVENLIIVLPASSISMLTVEAPTTKSRQLKQALPFLVEEQSAQEPDQIVLISDYKVQDNKLNVVTVDKALLKGCLAFFEHYGIEVSDVYAIEQLLPILDQQLLIILDQETCYISGPSLKPICVPAAQLTWILSRIASNETSDSLLNIKLVLTNQYERDYSDIQQEITLALPESISIEFYPERVESVASYLAALAGAGSNDSDHYQSLLVEEFKPKKKANGIANLLIPTLTFGVVVLCLQLSLSLYNGWQYQQKAHALQSDIYATVKRSIPGVRIEKLRGDKALRSRIKQALSRTSQSSDTLAIEKIASDLISALKSFSSDQPYIQRLSYRSNTGETQLELHAKSFAQVDQLKTQLDKSGYQVTVGSVTNDNGLFKGRITLQAKRG